MPGLLVSSFVVRFTEIAEAEWEKSDRHWRIKVSHVQSGEEATCATLEEVKQYMELMLERGRLA